MQAYTYNLTMGESGVLTLKNLPFDVGERIEVVIISRSESKPDKRQYPFWGEPITYLNPTDPVAETDWDVLK